MTGLKNDAGKLRWTLLPWAALETVVRVLEHGAKKYPKPDNYLKVANPQGRYSNAAQRHLVEILKGVWLDPESGFPHAAHLVVNGLFLLATHEAVPEIIEYEGTLPKYCLSCNCVYAAKLCPICRYP